MMAHPPYDSEIDRFYIIHFTYGDEYTANGEMIIIGAKLGLGLLELARTWGCPPPPSGNERTALSAAQHAAAVAAWGSCALLVLGVSPASLLCRPAPCWAPTAPPLWPRRAGDKGEPAWKFNKRDFYTLPPPRGLPELPLNVKNDIVSPPLLLLLGGACGQEGAWIVWGCPPYSGLVEIREAGPRPVGRRVGQQGHEQVHPPLPQRLSLTHTHTSLPAWQVRWLIRSINEAADRIPGWDAYAATGRAEHLWDGALQDLCHALNSMVQPCPEEYRQPPKQRRRGRHLLGWARQR